MSQPLNLIAEFVPLDKRAARRITYEHRTIDTLFTDLEAVGICGGLLNGQARQVWKRSQLKKSLPADTFAGHVYAMKTIEETDLNTVSFLLTLPPLPIGVKTTHKAFQLFDNLKSQQQRPSLRLIDKSGIKYSINFYYEEVTEFKETTKTKGDEKFSVTTTDRIRFIKRVYDYDTLVIETDEVKLARIYKNGKICPINDATTNRSVFELLLRFVNDPQKELVYYGSVTGNCSNCGLPISDKRSISAAVGPTCAQHLGFKWG
ncbi:DUF6011 domain-containing protein [Segetibacter aerophilus]|uniref:Uncharacterized protein n=1 Tax=Segetibacter aerophilus TaxID=670293 RepID=A0A512B8L0_9BACT|nr:DUF6011 domain-containing protein [Segetibacter aerophilus]GEO08301.1 hypothetical protein SAE01_07970 [Segetibacter aerophilus]